MKVYKYPDASQQELLFARPSLDPSKLESTIANVFAKVERGGDKALEEFTLEFDRVALDGLALPEAEIKRLAKQATPELKRAIKLAASNIHRFHSQQLKSSMAVETMPGVICWQESRPIERVGLYVPGGSAPLISTVLMLGIPAQIADCEEIVMCTPPDKSGQINPAICYAAQLVGVTRLIKVGGSQAIAAMSLGTESVPMVDKIFGPGNQYVMAAKSYAQKYGVAIDMPAGPSEVMIIADKSAKPAFVAADLLSQAEHGPDSQVVLLTDDKLLIEPVLRQVELQLAELSRRDIATKALNKSFCICFDNLDEAFEFANQYAPEHLILNTRRPKSYANRVINAGSVFLGAFSPESAGDYASGTNHTLPTGGWARSYGGVSVDSFTKQVSFQSLTRSGLKNLAPAIETIALAEGLDAHVRAVSIRLRAK